MPAEAEWIIQRHVADPTSGSLQEADATSTSLQKGNRRGTLVVPAEMGWIIKRDATDLTSRSLRKEIRRGTLVVPAEAYTAMENGLEFATVNRYPCPD